MNARARHRGSRRLLARRGTAVLEFVMAAPVMIMLLAAVADLGLAMRTKLRLANGVASAAQYAVLSGSGASSGTLSAIVKAASTLGGATASVSGPACGCPTGAPRSITAATCGSTCPNGGTAGTYVTITGTASYTPVLAGFSFVANTSLSETAVVRVQ